MELEKVKGRPGGVRAVGSLEQLATIPFGEGIQALCWPRPLRGNFAEVVARLPREAGVTVLEPEQLAGLSLSAEGREAVEMMREDFQNLQALQRDPVLNLINGYPRDEDPGPMATDVFSFHADRAPCETDTWLCTYHGAASEGLALGEAVPRVQVPETRAQLLELYGGPDDEGFVEFLQEGYYDLHYLPIPGARPYSFGQGNLWRIAVDWPGSPVPPCVHRAPETMPGDPLRLLLIC